MARFAELEKRATSKKTAKLEFRGRLRRPERVWIGIHSQQTMENIDSAIVFVILHWGGSTSAGLVWTFPEAGLKSWPWQSSALAYR